MDTGERDIGFLQHSVPSGDELPKASSFSTQISRRASGGCFTYQPGKRMTGLAAKDLPVLALMALAERCFELLVTSGGSRNAVMTL